MRRSWREIDAERAGLRPKLSRASMCRQAGISESTVTKGMKAGYVPIASIYRQVALVLDAERAMRDAGLR